MMTARSKQSRLGFQEQVLVDHGKTTMTENDDPIQKEKQDLDEDCSTNVILSQIKLTALGQKM